MMMCLDNKGDFVLWYALTLEDTRPLLKVALKEIYGCEGGSIDSLDFSIEH